MNSFINTLTTLVNLKSQCIVLHINRRGQHSRLIIGSVVRQAQHNLVLSLAQETSVKGKLVRNVVAAHRRAHGTRATVVIRDNPRLKILAVDVDRVLEVRVRLRRVVHIRISGGSLGSSELNRKGRLLLALELSLLEVKSDGPVVDISVTDIGLGAHVVGPSTKNAPVHIVKILGHIALTDLKVNTIREVLGEVVLTPVDAVLLRLQRLGRVWLETVAVLTRGLVGGSNAPELLARRLLLPSDLCLFSLASLDLDLILGELSKDAIGVDGQTVCASLNHGNGSSAIAVEIRPVLVGVDVKNVVLEVDAALGENGDGVLGSLGKIDSNLKGTTVLGGDVVGNMLGDGVVKVGVPLGISILSGIGLGSQDIRVGGEAVEMVVLRSEGAVKAVGDVGLLLLSELLQGQGHDCLQSGLRGGWS